MFVKCDILAIFWRIGKMKHTQYEGPPKKDAYKIWIKSAGNCSRSRLLKNDCCKKDAYKILIKSAGNCSRSRLLKNIFLQKVRFFCHYLANRE